VLPGHASPYFKDGSLKWGILWDPADAGYGMVWVANYLLAGNKITDGMEIPGMGKITLEGNVVKVDGMVDITPENADDFGF
jgi:simple sugar transport system substrate-binding protein